MEQIVKVATQPLASDVHVNRPLTNFGQKYIQDQRNFVALDAMPNLPVEKQGDLYWQFNRGDFYRDEAKERADGDESVGGSFRQSTDPYFARVYSFHKQVTDRQRANQDALQNSNLDETATRFVMQKLMIRRERLFAGAYMNATGTWTDEAGTGTTANVPANKWDAALGDPVVDIRRAIRVTHQRTGFRPNRMTIVRPGYDALLDNDNILSRINGGATTNLPAMVQRQLLAQLFELESIHVMDGVVNTGAKGATDAYSFIGGDQLCLVYYAPSSVGPEEPTAGVQFSWTGFTGATQSGMVMSRIREDTRKSDRIEGEMSFDYKVVAPDLGFMFSSILT